MSWRRETDPAKLTWGWPTDRVILCNGCGAEFSRNEQNWIVHPEPWCDAMIRGDESPRVMQP